MMRELEKAIQYVENDRVEEGLALIKELQKTASAEDKLLLAEQFYTWGLLEDAIALVDELLEYYPGEGELLLFKAEVYVDLEEEEKAIAILDTIESDDPIYVRGLLLTADLYQMQGLSEVAEAKLLEAKRLLPKEEVIDFGLGEFYLSQAEYRKAVTYYELLIEQKSTLDFNGIDLNQRLAESLCGIGEYEQAIPYFEKALDNKLEINTLFEYALAAYHAEHYQTAIEKFIELQALDPQYHSLYLFLARAYEHEAMLPEALEAVNDGIKQDEFNKELFFYKGKLALKMGDEETAEHALREGIAIDPGYIEAILTVSTLYMSQERYEDVIENIQTAVSYNEHDPHFDWDLARASKELELYEDAIKHYEAAYNVFKEDYAFLEEYGYFLLEEGQREQAKAIFTAMLAQNPTSVEIQDLLAQLQES